MSHKARALLERLPTGVTFLQFSASMHCCMFFHVTQLGKCFSTPVTNMCFLITMHYTMPFQIMSICKSLTTHITCMGSVYTSCNMYSPVPPQGICSWECQTTYTTNIWLFVHMINHVSYKMAFSSKTLPTQITKVCFLEQARCRLLLFTSQIILSCFWKPDFSVNWRSILCFCILSV
jgi:hypothetical protein